MADRTSRLIVRLIDGVSGPAKTAARSLQQLVGASKVAAMAPLGTMAAVRRDMALVQKNTEKITTTVSLPMAILGAVGAKTAYEFEKAGNTFRAVSGATAEQRVEIEKLARSMGMIKPTDAMKAAVELARTGFNPDQVKGTLPGTLKLALSGDIDVPQAADIATNILTAMRLPMANAAQAMASMARINDVLSYTANKSNTDIRLLGETFKYVGPIAAAAGISLEQVSAISAVMANNGIRGSEAGVAMRSALVRMVKPTKGMLGALAALNVNLNDFVTSSRKVDANAIVKNLEAGGINATGVKKQIQQVLDDPSLKFDPAGTVAKLTDVIVGALGEGGAMDRDKIAEAISNALLQSADKIDLIGFLEALKKKGATVGDLANIFDQRQGARLITALVGDVPTVLKDIMDNAFGYIEEAVKLRMEGVVGAWARFGAAFERVIIAIGKSGILQTVTKALEDFADALEGISKSNPSLLKWVAYAGLATVAMIPLGMAASGFMAVGGLLVGTLGLLGSASKVAGVATVAGSGRIVAGLGMIARGGLLRALTPFFALFRALRHSLMGFAAASMIVGRGGALRLLGASALGLLNPLRLIRGALTGLKVVGMGLARMVFAPLATVFRIIAQVGLALGSVFAGVSAPVAAAIAVIVGVLAAAGVMIWKYWDRIVAVFSGVGARIGEELAPAFDWVREKASQTWEWLRNSVGNVAEWFGADPEAAKAAFDRIFDFSGVYKTISDGLSSVGTWISEFLTPERLDAGGKASWEAWGYNLADGLVNAVKTKIDELVTWFASLPGRIMAAIGNIDISSLIRWPSMPSWLGGGAPVAPAPSGPPAPAADGAGGIGHRAAGGRVSRGSSYLVGEHRPEIFSPGQDGYIHPRVAAGPDAPPQVTNHISVSISGVGLDELAAQVERKVSQGIRNAMRAVQADIGLTLA
ncbi:phage tail tape measure protein [Xanthobacter sp. V0B-10]|uniref:phage tail tape measure protein n=1 Tax=Xanthobacter albus TaxID=3119929 RepID=UPI003728EC4E